MKNSSVVLNEITEDESDTDSSFSLALISLQDFIALTKPGVMSLVVFTGFVGMILAPGAVHPFLGFMIILSIALASGGAASINMWYDHDIDLLMKRTQKRPIPQGRVAREDALIFGILLSLLSIIFMTLSANIVASALLAFSIFYYAVIYTIALKRVTAQNIVIGGAAGAFPPVIGWVAVQGDFSLEPWLLFLIIFIWTPPHFWALAIHRLEDYQQANIPMLPNKIGALRTRTHIFVYSILLGISSFLPYIFKMRGSLYACTALILNTIFIGLSYKVFRQGSQKDCIRLFLFSILYLFLLFLGILLDYFWGE